MIMRRLRFIQEFMSKNQEDVIYSDKLRVVLCLKHQNPLEDAQKIF